MRSNLFLIVGEDEKIIEFNLYEIINKIEYDENNKITYDMDNNSFMDVIEEASMVSLFSPIKIITVNNFDLEKLNNSEIEYLEKYISSGNKDVYMILIAKKIDARKKNYKIFKDNFKIIEANKIDNNNILDYIEEKIKNNKFKIDKINIEYFLSKVGTDINNINNELEKLFIYKEENKIITKDDIDLLVINNIDNVIYEFTNAILDEDYDKIKIMYDNFMIDNISLDYLITSVAGSFRNALIIKLLSKKNMSYLDIGKIIGKKEYYVKKMLDRLYKYSIKDLSEYITKLAIIDRNFKSGKDNVGKFQLFLFNKNN